MLKAELLEIVRSGENSGVEFKRDDVRPEQLAKEIVALANFQGGRVLLGVEDDGRISGIHRPDLETWVMDTVFGRYVHPMILPFYEEVEVEAGKRVAVITVSMGVAKPYVVRHGDREEIFIRMGSTSRHATREQQARLFQSGGLLHAEALPVSGTALADLDLGRLTDYVINLVGDEEAPSSPEGWHERLSDHMRPFISREMMVDDLRRERVYRYPPEAIRESIVNAFVHRDWTRAAEIEVTNFSNRLEIISPGALQNSMTLEKMIAGQRSPRNSLIVDVMRDYGYVDARGMGVRRKIIPLTRQFTGQNPHFDLGDDYLRVVLPAGTVS